MTKPAPGPDQPPVPVRLVTFNVHHGVGEDDRHDLPRLATVLAGLDADLVVFSAGIRPADALARAAGLPVGERGGVLVDHRCRTSDEHVWAIGEVAALEGRTYGLVAPGYAMAEVVADRLLRQGELVGVFPEGFKGVGKPFSDEPYGVGMKKGDDALQKAVADAIKAHQDNGDYKKAFEATIGKSGSKFKTPPQLTEK